MRKRLAERAAVLKASPPLDRERDPRARMEIVGTIRIGQERLPARICDLSRRGFGARSVRMLPIGSAILVSLPMVGEVRAQVRWAIGGMFGARFVDPVDLCSLAALPRAGTAPAVPDA